MRSQAALLIATLVLSTCGQRGLTIESVQQGRPPTTSYGFVHEHWLQRDLWILRDRENLAALRAESQDDWALQLALCKWTRAQFQPGTPDPYPRANGRVILDEIRSGKTKGFCGQYSYLLADALKSVGLFDVRYVELESRAGPTHSSLEVWSNRWQKWIELDPYANAYFTLGGGPPLSVLEIHQALRAGNGGAVVAHRLEEHPGLPSVEKIVGFHHRFAVSLRNDLADAEKPPTIADRFASYLLHVCPASPLPEGDTFLHVTSEDADFRSPRNQTYLECAPAADGAPGFDCLASTRGTVAHLGTLLVSEDGESWERTGLNYRWDPQEGDALSVLAVNDQGWLSRPATVLAVAR